MSVGMVTPTPGQWKCFYQSGLGYIPDGLGVSPTHCARGDDVALALRGWSRFAT
jgi:hypothetical protein